VPSSVDPPTLHLLLAGADGKKSASHRPVVWPLFRFLKNIRHIRQFPHTQARMPVTQYPGDFSCWQKKLYFK